MFHDGQRPAVRPLAFPGSLAAQLLTGALSDRLGRKGMIVGGMLLQGMAIGLLPLVHGCAWWGVAMVLLGLGTALVGMKQVEHVRDNLTVARHAPLQPDQFTKLFT